MMKSRKIRRHPTDPPRNLRRFPGKLKLLRIIDHSNTGGFVAHCETRRWRWLNEEKDGVKNRDTYVWLFVGDDIVGFFEIQEFRVEWISNARFWNLMDSESKEAVDLAEILMRCWRDIWEDLAAEGPIVLLKQLWVAQQHARKSRWNDVIQELLATRFKRRCIVALKAFPLEYEAEGPQLGFRLRRRALVRHYRRLLGVEPFPGKPGRDGWLYAIPRHLLQVGMKKPTKLISIRRIVDDD
jgi:hypothetical protein